MHQKTFDLGREIERCERGKPAPVLDEVEPDAMAMGVVSMVAVVLLVVHANPRSVGDVGGGRLRTINLVRRAGRPSHHLYSAATRAHRS
jgi:hypothetical protein